MSEVADVEGLGIDDRELVLGGGVEQYGRAGVHTQRGEDGGARLLQDALQRGEAVGVLELRGLDVHIAVRSAGQQRMDALVEDEVGEGVLHRADPLVHGPRVVASRARLGDLP